MTKPASMKASVATRSTSAPRREPVTAGAARPYRVEPRPPMMSDSRRRFAAGAGGHGGAGGATMPATNAMHQARSPGFGSMPATIPLRPRCGRSEQQRRNSDPDQDPAAQSGPRVNDAQSICMALRLLDDVAEVDTIVSTSSFSFAGVNLSSVRQDA